VKCDEVRPACVQCRSKGLDCQGYGVRLRWMPPEQAYSAPALDAHPLANPRRPQRSLVALDPPRHVLQELEIDDILGSIDALEGGLTPRPGDDPFIIHNFGVFDSLGRSSEVTPSGMDESCSLSLHHGVTGGPRPQNTDSHLFGLTDDPGSWPNPQSTSVQLRDEYDDANVEDKRLRAFPQHYQWEGAGGAVCRNPSPTHLSALEQFLIYHYMNRVVHLFCVIDNDRSPWKTIHLPRALQSTGQLNVEGSSTRIRDALRNALMSISAFYLANDSTSRLCADEAARWTSEATLLRGKTIRLLKDAVNNDFGESPPKYKEFLATMLSMISINVMSGDTSTCGVHLDGAFRLISQARTWKLKYSNKARSLHRIYFYLRAIYESTAVWSPSHPSSQLDATDLTVPELTHWLNSDMLQQVGGGGSNNSNNKNNSRALPSARRTAADTSTRMNTYECIYGVPQSLLVLLWDATRLINDLVGVRDETRSPVIPDDLSGGPRFDIIYQTTVAFHNALIIYFAQNIRFLGHRFLQPYVEAVLKSIEAIERIKAEVHILAAPLYWPAFIAASEAFQDQLQERFRRWYDHVEMYGIAAVRTGITVLLEVWRAGPARGNALTSQWRDVVRRTDAKLMLS
ncbi:fungal-specific transcription factor domain-domain-containing protein, partial [Microdochium bolleyi]